MTIATAETRRIKLKDVCERITVGHVGPMADKYSEEGIPFLRSQNIEPFRLKLDDLKYIPPDFHEKLRKSCLRPGDVAVVRTGYPGTACVIPNGFTELNCADLVVITPSRELNPHYLAAIFNSAWGVASVAGNLVGVAQQHFNIGAARELEVSLPSRAAQDKISGILSAYDQLIENNQRRIRILEEMTRSLYREWFVEFRFPGHQGIRPAASPLGDIPLGWQLKKLGDLISYDRRATKPGAHLEERKYVPIDCLPSKSLALLEAKPIEEAQSSLQLFERGDILFGAMRPYFHKVVIAPFAGVTRTTCFVFKPLKSEWRAFATMLAFDETTVAYANAHSQGATIPYAVWDGSLAEMPLVLPPDTLLRRFENAVAPMLVRISQAFFTLNNLRRTRNLLLPQLLSGQQTWHSGRRA